MVSPTLLPAQLALFICAQRLELHFAHNVVSGSGSDDVGSYQITGRYSSDSRTIAFTKFYNLLNYGQSGHLHDIAAPRPQIASLFNQYFALLL